MSSKEQIYDRYRSNRTQDIVNLVFLFYMSVVFPIYMHDMYFDITLTRATVFADGVIFYLILMASAIALEVFMLRYYRVPGPYFYKDSKVIAMPEVWMLLFLTANFAAFCMAPDKTPAWTGQAGRRMGLSIILCLALMFIVLARDCVVNAFVYLCVCFSSTVSATIAILQHFGFDPFSLRERVVVKQKQMFISTFGNINTYSSFIAIVLPIFVAVFIFSKKLWERIVAAFMIMLLGAAIIPGKSDNVYLGLLLGFVILFYLAVWNKKVFEYFFGIMLMAAGLFVLAIFNDIYSGSQKHINGIARGVESPTVMGAFVILMFILSAIFFIFRKISLKNYEKVQSKQFLIGLTIFLIIMSVGVMIWGSRSKYAIFHFNDKWGTYRGYIWRRGFDLFLNGTPLQKIFGYGNETIGSLMKNNYYNEMVSITGKKYDNCHNEYLQYLVTTGLFGAISYIGLFFSSMIYMIKRAKGDAVVIACLASAAAYAGQALVNLNQPITSPFYFVILAAGIGFIRYRDQGFGIYNK